jgi:hypothetical protein
MIDREFARAFERGEVPNADFHHVDHLRLAWVYLEELPSLDAATARMAGALRRFAASAGKPEKYSDAITGFFMRELAAKRDAMPGAALADVLRAHPRLLDKDASTATARQD